MPHKTLFIIAFILCCMSVEGKICSSTDIRNNIVMFENKLRNCTVIVGFLQIVLFDHCKDEEFENLSFPELTEITGYLLLYRVYCLTSLRKLFPNLSVIRGATLLSDFALVIHHMPALHEIGLYKLSYIGRGSVRIDAADQLCFIDTINWEKIGTSVRDYRKHKPDSCPKCPAECNDYCWNELKCQIMDDTKCHPECIECEKHHSAKHCLACKNFLNDDTCVSKCPKNKYKHALLSRCVTKSECSTLVNETWFVFGDECLQSCPPNYNEVSEEEGWCVYCGDKCVRKCKGMRINNLALLDSMKGCTHISGNLEIRIETKDMIPELENNLGAIVEVDEYIKISRSQFLKSLDFFKSLKVIHGKKLDNNKYSLVILQNPDLHKLWDLNENFTLKILNGSMSAHDNPQLCYTDIEKFTHLTGIKNYTNIDISPSSNGYKSSCTPIKLKINVTECTANNVTIIWEDYKFSYGESLIGYFLYYIKYTGREIKFYDVCGETGWESIFVENNMAHIEGLKPFTKYAYYIKTYSSTRADRRSVIRYFTTLSDDPSPPLNVQAFSTSSSSISLSWNPPEEPNGLLSHYVITGYLIEDKKTFMDQRNYCKDPLRAKPKKPDTSFPSIAANTSKTTDCCHEDVENKKFESLCDNLDIIQLLDGNKQSCHKYMYRISDNNSPIISNSITEFGGSVIEKRNSIKKPFPENKFKPLIELKTNDSNINSYEIENLRHYTMYVFLLSACNNATDRQQCSSVVMVWQRTKKEENADDVSNTLNLDIKDDKVKVHWKEPKYPNSVILAYEISLKRIGSVHNHDACIQRMQHERAKYVYNTTLLPGTYTLKIRAISLAGPANYSKERKFEIILPSEVSSVVIIIVTLLVICIVFVSFAFSWWYKKQKELRNNHLITSINPDYAGTVYIEDEWEMERSDIEILKDLGQGTFGMVYNGFIKSKNRPCAIKTVNEGANVHDRMEFLNEASVMKSFSEAHHVVCLLGVVSRGQPPLVIMELMERGDLKSFLRRSRDSSHCITCAEMYRMAAEIADGMAYLTAKKFVHRDLAARNCMVAHDHTVKIGDFGMARDIYETDYYRKESKGLLPVRWMAPESLADGVFTSDSDVWSYGIVLWEMTTLAEQPYQGLANEQVFQFVIAKGTLERPPECPDLLYDIMEACWMWRPNDRPQFTNIVEKLEKHVGQDFQLVSFYHSREGEEYKMNAHDRVYNQPAMTVAPREHDMIAHWNASDEEEVSLYSEESSRPNKYLPFFNQRQNKSRTSNYHLTNNSPSNYTPYELS